MISSLRLAWIWFPTLRGKVQALIFHGRWWHKEESSAGRADLWERTCKWNYQGRFRRESRIKPQTGPFPLSPPSLAMKKSSLLLSLLLCLVLEDAESREFQGVLPKALLQECWLCHFPALEKGLVAPEAANGAWSSCQLSSSMGIDVGIDVGNVCDAPAVNFPVTV